MIYRFLSLFLIITVLFSCNKEDNNSFKLNITTDEAANGKLARLFKMDKNKTVTLDSAVISNGEALLKGHVESPDIYQLIIGDNQSVIPVIVENTDMKITIDSDSIFNARVKGSEENDTFNTYLSFLKNMQDKSRNLAEQFQLARQANDSVSVDSIQKQFETLKAENEAYDLEFIKKHNDAVIAVLLLERLLLSNRIAVSEAKTLYDNFSDRIKATRAGKNVSEAITRLETTAVGSIAPNFSAPNPEGKIIALNDIKDKVTIIDFWAAWCGPCRKENPNIVNLYNKYHDKGLEIIGVSLDGTPRQKDPKQDWLDAIKNDGLIWHQVSNLEYFNDTIAKQYGITAIPATFVLDENGKIVAKGLRGQDLENKIAELLQ